MALFMFNRRAGNPDADASRTLGDKVRELLALAPEDGVSISEIACSHPECGDAETVILVMRSGRRTEAVKVLKPMRQVTPADLAEALASLAG